MERPVEEPAGPAAGNRGRRWALVVAAVATAMVAATSLVWFAPDSPTAPNGLSPAAPGPLDGPVLAGAGELPPGSAGLVVVNGVSYGRADFATVALAQRGVSCSPAPEATTTLTERAPDPSGMARDLAPVDALVGIDREVFNCLAQCLPTDPERWFGVDLAAGRPCFDETTVALVREVGLVETWRVMRALLAGWPQVSFFCHLSGHKAGQAAFDVDIDLAASLVAVGDDCIAGAMHGLLDAFGESTPPLADFDSPIAACVELNSGRCADGIGHAAWTAYRDYGLASEVCGRFDEELFRHTCDGGVFMRQFEENDLGMDLPDAPELDGHDRWLAMVVDLCAQYRAENRRTVAEDPGLGCWATSPYLLWMPIAIAARTVAGELDQIPEFDARLAEIAAACDAMGPVGAPACREAYGENVAPVAGYDRELSAEVCTMLAPDLAVRAQCIKEANELIDYSSGAR
jgi:hypothetical protein